MANPFQRYQSGSFEAVPGIAQAGANIGSMLGSGFGNLGANLASGLKQYYENTAKSKAADEEIGVVGQQLMSRQQAYMEAAGVDPALIQRYLNDDLIEENGDRESFAELGKNPMVRYAKQLQPVLDSLKSSPNKGLSSKLSALNSAKASFGMIDEQMKLDDFVAKYRLEQAVNDLPTNVQTTEDVTTSPAFIDPNNPFFENVRTLKKQLEENYRGHHNSPEMVERGIKNYIKQVKGKYGGQEMTEDQKFEFAAALERYAFDEVTDVGEETPLGKQNASIRASYEESMAESKARQEAPAEGKAKKTPRDNGMTRAQLTQRKADLDEKIKTAAAGVKVYDEQVLSGTKTEYFDMHKRHRDKRAADLEYLKGERSKLDDVEFAPLTEEDAMARITARATETKRKPLELKENLNNIGSSILKNVTEDVLQRIAEGEPLTVMDIGKQITALDNELNPTVTEVNIGPYGRGLGSNIRLPSQRTPARKIFDAAAKKLGIRGDTPITDEQFLQLQKEMLKGVETQSETALKAADELKGVTPEKITADLNATAAAKLNPSTTKPAVKSKPFSVGELELGSRLVDVQLNAAERESAAREFYSKRFGSVPTGFTQMYRQMYPEASVRMTEVNGVPVMVDGKGNVTPLASGNRIDVEKAAGEKALTFDNTEIASGVRLTGLFTGTVTGAMKFRTDYAHMANVRFAVEELIKINDMGYESLSPTARARAEQLQSEIIAAMRVPIIGSGQVAIPEQEILRSIIKNPTGIFSLESAERAALNGLRDRMNRELTNWPKSMGLEVSVSGQESDVIKQVRMRRLRSQRNLPESN